MKFRSLLFFLLFLQFAHAQNAQKNDKFFVFDKDWQPADVKKASYFLRVRQINDSSFEWLYYNMFGPRIKVENYKDTQATIKNGKFTYFSALGTIDSAGNYFNNQLDGEWFYFNILGQTTRKKTYYNGVLLSDSSFAPKEAKKKDEKLDSVERESEYPGGQAAWQRFLIKNFHYPDRAMNNNIQGQVVIQFIIDKDGSVIQPEISRSVEYSLDEEAIHIIGLCGKWIPAVQFNRKVKSFKKQPFVFKLDAQ